MDDAPLSSPPNGPARPLSPGQPSRPIPVPRPRFSPGRLVLFPRWTGVTRLVLARLSEEGARGAGEIEGLGRAAGAGNNGLGYETALDWGLVLHARRVPVRVERTDPRMGPGYEVKVPGRYAAWAVDELCAYLAENPDHVRLDEPDAGHAAAPGHRWAVLAPYFGLLLFYLLILKPLPAVGLYPHVWLNLGAGDAGKILAGEWWRAGTALTLHADPAHALSNAVVGGAFALVLWPRVGAGLGLFLTVAAGFFGNLLNAWAMGPAHGSIGFSTAVFGAAGVLGALALAQKRVHTLGPRLAGMLVPVAAGLGLVALLGVGDESAEFGGRVDLGAHLFGFLAGIGLGWLAGACLQRAGPLSAALDRVFYAAAWLFPALCWWAALVRG